MTKLSLNKKRKTIILSLSILLVLGLAIYLSRQVFFFRYEPEYYENWYYHSQWNIPNSTRGISDSELYKFVGYRLAEGENPFDIEYEVPPFGKYLYGLAEKYIGNPYWISIFFYLSSIVVLFFLSKKLFQNLHLSLLALLLFVTTPFVSTQIQETMLDLPLMFLYLVHAWLFLKYLSDQKLIGLAFSGVFLGLATGTKIGVYTPLVMAFGLFLIFLTSKKILDLIFYSGSVLAGYMLSYFCYFIKHPNPIPWLRLQEKPLKIYLSSGIPVDHFNQWKTIFLNSYQGWWQPGQKISLNDWSFILPLGVIVTIIILVWAIKKNKKQWIYVSGLSLVFLIVNTFVPFWPRYLMPIVPLFVLSIAFLFRKTGYIILLISLLNLPFFVNSLAFENVSTFSQETTRSISTRAYRELYRAITPEERENLPEQDFINLNETFLEKLGTRDIEITVIETVQSQKYASIKYQLKYITKYGEISHEPTLDFIKVNNQWRLVWKWNYLWPGYDPESKIVVNEKTIPFLRLENENGLVIARRASWKAVYIIPRLMFDWNEHLNALSEITGESPAEVDKRIRAVVPDQYPRFAGYLDPALRQEEIEKALSIPGVSLQDIDYAVIPRNITPDKSISKMIRNIQKEKPELFYIQAEVYIENNKGEKISIPFKKPDQKDVVIRM